jgi:hypothetical protein
MTNEQRPSDEVLEELSINCLIMIQYLEGLTETLKTQQKLNPELNDYFDGSIVVINLLKQRILEKVPQ